MTKRVGRFKHEENEEERIDRENLDVDFSTDKPATPKVQNNLTTKEQRAMSQATSNKNFTRPLVKSISEVVTETDLAKELTGLNELQDTEVVITSLRIGKGDKFEPDREVAYCEAYLVDTQEDIVIVSSAYYVVAQLKAVEAKKGFPVLVKPVLKPAKNGNRWELE